MLRRNANIGTARPPSCHPALGSFPREPEHQQGLHAQLSCRARWIAGGTAYQACGAWIPTLPTAAFPSLDGQRADALGKRGQVFGLSSACCSPPVATAIDESPESLRGASWPNARLPAKEDPVVVLSSRGLFELLERGRGVTGVVWSAAEAFRLLPEHNRSIFRTVEYASIEP
jgi:hypothetical protein